jgi:predicted metal-dependent peptidase
MEGFTEEERREMESKAMSLIEKAYFRIIMDHALEAGLVMALANQDEKRLVDVDWTCKTGWTDGTRIACNPDFILRPEREIGLGGQIPYIMTFLAHEGWHPALKHHLRIGNRIHPIWNEAGDEVINAILQDEGYQIPSWALNDWKLRNMNTEEIYAKKLEKHEEMTITIGIGEGEGDPDPGSMGEVRNFPGEQGDGEKEDNGNGGASTAEKKIEDERWTQVLIGAIQEARSRKEGKIPWMVERLIKDLTSPKLPWREILGRFIEECSKSNYTWRKPNKRYAASGFILPTLLSSEISELINIVDSSGSVSQDDLKIEISELRGALMAYKVSNMKVIFVDAKVQGDVAEISSADAYLLDQLLLPKGGGGTDYRPGFDLIKEKQWMPKGVIYLTDGYCSDFPKDPGIPVIWIIIPNGDRDFKPPFGEVIWMEKK